MRDRIDVTCSDDGAVEEAKRVQPRCQVLVAVQVGGVPVCFLAAVTGPVVLGLGREVKAVGRLTGSPIQLIRDRGRRLVLARSSYSCRTSGTMRSVVMNGGARRLVSHVRRRLGLEGRGEGITVATVQQVSGLLGFWGCSRRHSVQPFQEEEGRILGEPSGPSRLRDPPVAANARPKE